MGASPLYLSLYLFERETNLLPGFPRHKKTTGASLAIQHVEESKATASPPASAEPGSPSGTTATGNKDQSFLCLLELLLGWLMPY